MIQTRRATFALLSVQRENITHAHHEGALDDKEAGGMLDRVDTKLKELYRIKFTYEMPMSDKIIMQVPMFNALSVSDLK